MSLALLCSSRVSIFLRILVAGLGAAVLAEPRTVRAAPADLDLETAVQQALRHNLALAAAARNLDIRQLDIEAADAKFRWRIQPNVRAGATDRGSETGYGLSVFRTFTHGAELSVRGQSSRFPELSDPDWTAAVTAEISQPLLRNAGVAAQREPAFAAKDQWLSSRRAWAAQKADLAMDVIRTFAQLYLLERRIAGDQAYANRLARLQTLASIRERQGRASRVDTLRAEVLRDEADARLAGSREQAVSLKLDLADLLGADPAAEFRLIPPPRLTLDPPLAADAVRWALAHRLDYAEAQQAARTARRHTALARRDLLPDLNLVARHESRGTGATFRDSWSDAEDRWFFGLSSDGDWTRARERIAFRQAQLSEDAAETTLALKARTVTREAQQALTQLRRTRTQVDLATRTARTAARRAELARNLFEHGRGDAFSVTDAEESAQRAELDRLQAETDADLAAYELLHALGTLVPAPADLRPTPPPPEGGL